MEDSLCNPGSVDCWGTEDCYSIPNYRNSCRCPNSFDYSFGCTLDCFEDTGWDSYCRKEVAEGSNCQGNFGCNPGLAGSSQAPDSGSCRGDTDRQVGRVCNFEGDHKAH